jgi:hypothetical protein
MTGLSAPRTIHADDAQETPLTPPSPTPIFRSGFDMTISKPAIATPKSDFWLVGGLSILALSLLAVSNFAGSNELVLENYIILTVLLNGTHFLASYRLLYSSRAFALTYPWASVYVPALLVIYGFGALILTIPYPSITLPVELLLATASLYLALHYTGQAWGMMASFAYLDGVRFQPHERRILRLCLRTMAIWHAVWALRLLWTPSMSMAPYVELLSYILNTMGVLSLVVGVLCLASVGRANGQRVTARIVVPYVALHVWYAFLYVFPQSIFWVQIFHALQYLPFPFRVELNRASHSPQSKNNFATSVAYLGTLAALSAIIFGYIPWSAEAIGPGARSVWVVIAAIINIHHYFIDGCIWHISNPVVSQELFAHTKHR